MRGNSATARGCSILPVAGRSIKIAQLAIVEELGIHFIRVHLSGVGPNVGVGKHTADRWLYQYCQQVQEGDS